MKEKSLKSTHFSARILPLDLSMPAEEDKNEETMISSPVSDKYKRTLPERFLLLKFGKNSYTKDARTGEFIFTEEDASTLIDEFLLRKKDLVIDFEHQSISGKKAPAAGWIKALEKSQDGLVAIIKYWTKEAEELLLNGQYRYFSPTLYFSSDGKRVISLHSVALTNHPALHDIPPLAADDLTENPLREKGEEKKEIFTEKREKEEKEPEEKNLLAQLADLQEKEARLDAFLLLHSVSSLEELSRKWEEEKTAKRNEKILQAFHEGKLTENMRSWAENLLQKSPELFDSFLQCAPKIVPDNLFIEQALPAKANSFSDPGEEKIFAMLGLPRKEEKDPSTEMFDA